MNIIDLKAEHFFWIGDLVDVQRGHVITPEGAVDIEAAGGKTVINDAGDVIMIAGVYPRWDGVGLGWAWLSRKWRGHAKEITIEMHAWLNASGFHRIEIGVLAGFKAGERWAKRLGFTLETPMARKWGPDGRDYSIWVRVS